MRPWRGAARHSGNDVVIARTATDIAVQLLADHRLADGAALRLTMSIAAMIMPGVQ
jgi:hypothetical protein